MLRSVTRMGRLCAAGLLLYVCGAAQAEPEAVPPSANGREVGVPFAAAMPPDAAKAR